MLFENENDIKFLERVWQNEKFTKEILKYEDHIEAILAKVETKEEELNKNKKNEEIELIELDIERIKYYIKDYLRIRLAKVEKYLFYIIKNDFVSNLSHAEFEFASNLFKLRRAYFEDNLYKKINPQLNDFNVDGQKGNINPQMIQYASENTYVVIKSVSEDPIMINLKDVYEESLETKTIYKDEIFCLPFKLVK
jgi:hypothetical protein